MKVQQTLAQTWKRRRDSDHATARRLIAERGVGLLGVPDELLDIILGYSDLRTRFKRLNHALADPRERFRMFGHALCRRRFTK